MSCHDTRPLRKCLSVLLLQYELVLHLWRPDTCPGVSGKLDPGSSFVAGILLHGARGLSQVDLLAVPDTVQLWKCLAVLLLQYEPVLHLWRSDTCPGVSGKLDPGSSFSRGILLHGAGWLPLLVVLVLSDTVQLRKCLAVLLL